MSIFCNRAPVNTSKPPKEIPWKFLAQNQYPIEQGASTSIAILSYEPQEQEVIDNYPDHRLVYFKFILSVSPIVPYWLPEEDWAKAPFQEGLPIKHILLDISLNTPTGKPFFLSASPQRREMIETGILGGEVFEGESDGISIGKSGSQMNESMSARASTTTESSGFGGSLFGLIGGSTSTVNRNTNVESKRNATQFIETTSRDASQERKELLSHTTNVHNVFSLLSLRYVGTPYLRFKLAPRPMSALSIDPSDPSLWYYNYLKYISSGLEGIQEFFAVAAIPKSVSGIELKTAYRYYAIVDPPPVYGPENWNDPWWAVDPETQTYRAQEVEKYLYEKYPSGTPVEELDVDFFDELGDFKKPIVWKWMTGQQADVAGSWSQSSVLAVGDVTSANAKFLLYKTLSELWLEYREYMYEKEIRRYPASGLLYSRERSLDLELRFQSPVSVERESASDSESKLIEINALQGEAPDCCYRKQNFLKHSLKYTRVVNTYNQLDKRIEKFIENEEKTAASGPFRFSDPRILGICLKYWSEMPEEDSRNISFDGLQQKLNLPDTLREKLTKAGVKTLRDFARIILRSNAVEAHNKGFFKVKDDILKIAAAGKGAKAEALKPPVSQAEVNEIMQFIGAALQKTKK